MGLGRAGPITCRPVANSTVKLATDAAATVSGAERQDGHALNKLAFRKRCQGQVTGKTLYIDCVQSVGSKPDRLYKKKNEVSRVVTATVLLTQLSVARRQWAFIFPKRVMFFVFFMQLASICTM